MNKSQVTQAQSPHQICGSSPPKQVHTKFKGPFLRGALPDSHFSSPYPRASKLLLLPSSWDTFPPPSASIAPFLKCPPVPRVLCMCIISTGLPWWLRPQDGHGHLPRTKGREAPWPKTHGRKRQSLDLTPRPSALMSTYKLNKQGDNT